MSEESLKPNSAVEFVTLIENGELRGEVFQETVQQLYWDVNSMVPDSVPLMPGSDMNYERTLRIDHSEETWIEICKKYSGENVNHEGFQLQASPDEISIYIQQCAEFPPMFEEELDEYGLIPHIDGTEDDAEDTYVYFRTIKVVVDEAGQFSQEFDALISTVLGVVQERSCGLETPFRHSDEVECHSRTRPLAFEEEYGNGSSLGGSAALLATVLLTVGNVQTEGLEPFTDS